MADTVRTKKKKTNGGFSVRTTTLIVMMPTPSLAPATAATATAPTPSRAPTPAPTPTPTPTPTPAPTPTPTPLLIEPQPSIPSRTSQTTNHSSQNTLGMGSSSTTRNKILIRPIGDRFDPHKHVPKVIAKAIKANFGEGYPSWKKVPEERRKLWFEEFKKVYTWAEADDAQIKMNFEARGLNKFISITKAVRKKKSQPSWVGDAAYAKVSAHWQTDKYKELCETAMGNHNIDSGASLHTSGAKPHISIWEEMKKENDGVDPSMDDFFTRTHKIQNGEKIGDLVSPQSQQRFEHYSKLNEEVLSNAMNETEGTSQNDVTQLNTQPSELVIFAQSVEGKKKGRVAMIGSLGKALDDNFLTPTHVSRPLYDDPEFSSMKNRMEELEQENQQLKQQLESNNAKLDAVLRHMNIQLP